MHSIYRTRGESSASNSAWIPYEIIIKILSRLPVKTLLQFKCVCKSWKSLISDTNFIKKNPVHMSSTIYPLHRHLLFGNKRTTHLESISLDFVLDMKDNESIANPSRSILQLDEISSRNLQPVGSCNGLILLFNQNRGPLLLWNPSIRETKILPDGELYTPHRMKNLFNFGYDSILNDYKVVEVSERRASLYSLRANSWRRIADVPYTLRHSFPCCGNVFIWTIDYLNHENWEIFISFDLVKELFQEQPLPIHGRYCMLSELQGDVCAMYEFDSHIAVYNKSNGTYKAFMFEDSRMYSAEIYVESLVSPNGD